MERKKVVTEKIHQKQDAVEAGQSTINNGSESVLEEFESCMSLFLFLLVFVSLGTSKQRFNRLGVGLSLGHK
jgi:hypothetical protein